MHILNDTTFIKGFIIIIVCFSLIALTDAQSCICMQYMGNHCGDRIREGLLRGYCEKNYLYHCSAAYFPAQTNKLCKSCQHSTKPGIDFCENGGEGPQNQCKCLNVLGVHCGIRKNYGYLSGYCPDDHLFYCYDINVKAYLKGICSWCAKGSQPGIDYCAIG